MAALTVEHLKVLLVEHLKVLNSRACLRILISRAPCRVLAAKLTLLVGHSFGPRHFSIRRQTGMPAPAGQASENDSSRTKGNFHVQFSGGGRSPTGSPTYLGLGLSGGPTHPNREYAGIREKQHLTMPMTNRILTYQWVPEEIAMIATVSVSKRCDKVFESLCNVLIECLVA